MEFNTLTRRVAEKIRHRRARDRGGCEAVVGIALPPPAGERRPREARRAGGKTQRPPFAPAAATLARKRGRERKQRTAPSPRSRSPPRAPRPRATHKIDRSKYETVRTLDRLKAWIARAHETGVVAVDTETTSLDPMQARAVRLLARASRRTKPATCRSAIAKGGGGGRDLFAPEPSCARPDPGRRRARRAQAAAGRPERAQGRAEPEIRLADVRAARHRDRRLRRHHADVLRARRRQGRPRHGRSRRSAGSATRPSISSTSPAPASRRSPSTASPSTRRPNTPPRTPT